MGDLSDWRARTPVDKVVLEGRFVRLEPLDAKLHGQGLFEASTMSDAKERFRYLLEEPPENIQIFKLWLEKVQASRDPLYFAVIDKTSGKVAGRQTFLRTNAAHGVTEIGHIFWSALISRKPATTEAYYLFAKYVFEKLGYRRFEWKCNDKNEPSKRAALRYGCKAEGVHRQALVVKGENRDTAWFSMLDHEWPVCKAAFESWLSPENFDEHGQQIEKLEEIRLRLQPD